MTKICKYCKTEISFWAWYLNWWESWYCENEQSKRFIKKRNEERERKEQIQKRDSKRYWDKQKEK